MLFENPLKIVELHVDSLIYGTSYFDYSKIKDSKAVVKFAGEIAKWIGKRISKTHDDEYTQLTASLYSLFLGYRISGMIKGELKDVDDKIPILEEEKQKLIKDNEKLASILKDAYIPSQIQDLVGVK